MIKRLNSSLSVSDLTCFVEMKMTMSRLIEPMRTNRLVVLIALAVMMTGSAASADTLVMPTRAFLMGQSEVLWGVTTQANGTAFVVDFGDGSAQVSGPVVDRSYMALNHTYALSGPFTAKLCVGPGAALPACPGGAELASVVVNVFNGALLSASDLRGLNINRAIQDGLRWLWVNQNNRTTDFDTQFASWGNYTHSFTSLVVLAFENQGYHVPSDDSAPTGLYERFVVQKGLNYDMNRLGTVPLNVQTAGDPCVGTGIEMSPCTGLQNTDDGNPGYGTAIAALPLAGSLALNRHAIAGLGSAAPPFSGNNAGFVAGKTYGEILQRIMDTVAWGQNDGATCSGRGGWIYGFSNNGCQQSDGSTVGWDILALLDAAAAGITEPAFEKSEFAFALTSGFNTDGTFDYRADTSASTDSLQNMARAGIGLQSLFYNGQVGTGDPQVAAGRDAVNLRWLASPGTDYLATCSGFTTTDNKGCSYAMFNVFKGFRVQGITSILASADWYGEYVDWLVANQSSPQSTSGGGWFGGTNRAGTTGTAMVWSCCTNNDPANAAIAELILAPVTLVPPDPILFSTVGLSPASATNPVGTDHTVTAWVQA